jgi:GTPase SAR1 family protein/predicted MPP superfamily phosphohydrolase
VLNTSELSRILPPDRYPIDKHRFIIEMMRKFELCFAFDDDQDTLLIPDLFAESAPPEIDLTQKGLLFTYKYDLLPRSIISRFIVRMKAYLQEGLYWRSGVKLVFLENQALVRADLDQKKIYITVTGKEQGRGYFLQTIRAELQEINKSIPNLKITELIPLPEHEEEEVEYKRLLNLQEMGIDFYVPMSEPVKIPLSKLLEGINEPLSKESNKSTQPDYLRHEDLKPIIAQAVKEAITNMPLENKEPQQVSSQPQVNNQQQVSSQPASMKQLNPSATKNILHLSDIHLGAKPQAEVYRNKLILDLRQNLKLEQLDYLIISGDLANKATPDEYEAAFEMLNELKNELNLRSNQIIMAPGNHDLNWDASEDAYQQFIPSRKLPTSLDPLDGTYIRKEGGALKRDEAQYRERFTNFATFYRRICGQPYPLAYEDQAIIQDFAQDKLLFLTLNSAWKIDHHYKTRAAINDQALSKAVVTISAKYKDYYKIAVWHHPVSGRETMPATGFLELLTGAGFEVCLHGHIHEAQEGFYKYDNTRGLHIIGGGTFGAPAREQVTGIPLQYNLLQFDLGQGIINVNTRNKEKTDGAWSADARWGDKEAPKPEYQIELKKKPTA